MRNINAHYYRIVVETVDSSAKDINGAIIPTYTPTSNVWAKKRVSRQGSSSVKTRTAGVEVNVERLEFRILPEVPVEWNNIIRHRGERYEIAAIQEFKDETVVVCYTTPLSNTRRDGSTLAFPYIFPVILE